MVDPTGCGVARQLGDRPLTSRRQSGNKNCMGRIHPLETYRQSFSPPLSKADLAKELGLSRSYLHRVLLWDRFLGKTKLKAVAEKTGIAPAALRPDLVEALKEPEGGE